jgi:hypothetical protein
MKLAMLYVELGINATNDDIVDQMRIMKRAREERLYTNVVCMIRGFDNDSRPLVDIPEVRAFCRRLVDRGFISYLDYSTTITGPKVPEETQGLWGAAEVWFCAEGKREVLVSLELLKAVEKVVLESNVVADRTLGPMEMKR